MVEIIHKTVKGRARLKVLALYRNEHIKQRLHDRLSKCHEITAFNLSTTTGSVLIFFNSGNTHESIADKVQKIILEETPKQTLQTIKTSTALSKPQSQTASAVTKPKSTRKVRKAVISAQPQAELPFHLIKLQAIIKHFEADIQKGLSTKKAKELAKKFGPNLLPEAVPRSGWSIFINQFKSLPVLLLGVAAGISLFTGGLIDAVVIASVITINAFIGYYTEIQAEKTIHSLKSLVRPIAMILRDGEAKQIPAEDIVPSDILILKPGSYVAADARIIESNHLSIDESALTGESLPVSKSPEDIISFPLEIEDVGKVAYEQIPLADRTNMVYMGTLVTGGQGLAIVTATGKYTEIGKIQALVTEAKPPETPMQRQLEHMSTQLVIISSAVCGLVFVIGMLRGYGFLQMLKSSISLAVAAVPEGLPTVATTTLALGIKKMRRHNVLIRHLEAVETLGALQTICLDKTGTITYNRMSVVLAYSGMKKLKVTETQILQNDIPVNPYENEAFLRLLHVVSLCSESSVELSDGVYNVQGSATENALIYFALQAGVNVIDLRRQFPLLKVRHRCENCNIMVTLHKTTTGDLLIAVKGSPSETLAICSRYMDGQEVFEMTQDDREAIEEQNEKMAAGALRVLGVAFGYIKQGQDWSDDIDICGIPINTFDLTWLGLVGMIDPVREGLKDLIAQYHKAGINTVMITGDQSPTAYAIGKYLNLSNNEQLEILDSSRLSEMPEELMKALAQKVHVFARVSPANKLQIVQAIQSAGRVVAMTGDGINDGPALKAADIGIAMGHTGTDVAREVADVVLEDDNLQTMIVAISQGRTIYNNIRKSIHFLLSTNLSEIIVMLSSVTLGLGHPLNAMQLLWINLVSDIAPGLALAMEPPEPDVMSKPPRNSAEPIIDTSDFKRVAFESATISAGTMSAYGYGLLRYGAGAQSSAIAFMTLTTSQLLHALSCRSEHAPVILNRTLKPNRLLSASIIGSLTLQGLALVLPPLRSLLGISQINPVDIAAIAAGSAVPLLINEFTKNPKTENGK